MQNIISDKNCTCNFKNKTAVITGASRGIGRATAIALSQTFGTIVIISKSGGKNLADTKKEIDAFGFANCLSFTGDVSDYNFISNTFTEIKKTTRSIDVLINNAGISTVGLFMDMSIDEWTHTINTNLTSIYNTCHAALPFMVEQKYGKIINVSSVWGLCGASCEVAYSATKGAINSFTKALAKELAPSNIAVNAIAFGAVDTDMNSHLDAEEKQMLADEIPYGRMATPEEAAECIKNIITMPNYLTGEVIKFDGAWI